MSKSQQPKRPQKAAKPQVPRVRTRVKSGQGGTGTIKGSVSFTGTAPRP
jgi:hypothetical protein